MKNSAFVFVFGMISMLVLVFAFHSFQGETETKETASQEKAEPQEKKEQEEFAFLEEYERREVKVVDPCRFDTDSLPDNLEVYMADAEAGAGKLLRYPMDASGEQARQIDVQVHSFKQPIGLVLMIFKKNAARVYFAQDGQIHIGAPASADTVFYAQKD